jgi:hypothetical protein
MAGNRSWWSMQLITHSVPCDNWAGRWMHAQAAAVVVSDKNAWMQSFSASVDVTAKLCCMFVNLHMKLDSPDHWQLWTIGDNAAAGNAAAWQQGCCKCPWHQGHRPDENCVWPKGALQVCTCSLDDFFCSQLAAACGTTACQLAAVCQWCRADDGICSHSSLQRWLIVFTVPAADACHNWKIVNELALHMVPHYHNTLSTPWIWQATGGTYIQPHEKGVCTVSKADGQQASQEFHWN